MKKAAIKVCFAGEIILVVVLVLLNLAAYTTDGHFARANRLGSDGATFVLTATAHNFGLGVPYKDYWEYRPPGYYLLIDLWSRAFGTTVLSFKILESLVRFLIGIQICFLLRKIFSPFQALIVSFITLAVFFSPVFGTLLYPEAYCIFFSLAALLSLFYIQNLSLRFLLASFFFSVSMQLKDVFAGATLALIPPFISLLILHHYRSFFKAIAFSILGFILPIAAVSYYLINLNAFNAYQEVLRHKAALYPLNIWTGDLLGKYIFFFWGSKEYITIFRNIGLFLLISPILIILVSFIKKRLPSLKIQNYILILYIPRLKLSINSPSLTLTTIIFYVIGSFFGPSLMKTFSPHYVLAVIIPTYLFWAIITLMIENFSRTLFRQIPKHLIFLLLSFALLFPQQWVTVEYQKLPLNIFTSAYKNMLQPESDLLVEKYISLKTKPSDCILSVYGWKSSDAYLFTGRQPCTRFFIPNVVEADWQKKEYRNTILNNPPQAVVYSYSEADMDPLRFEREVINFSRILNHCYQQDFSYTQSDTSGGGDLKLYFPIYWGEQLKSCINKNV